MRLSVAKMSALVVLAALVGIEHSAAEASDDAEAAKLEVFVGPGRDVMKNPRYPRSQLLRGYEGWVHLNFMIDPKGKAYEIAVTDSTGDPDFEESAMDAVRRSTFQPARIDGVPVDAGYGFKISFAVQNQTGARQKFRRLFRRFSEAAESGNRAEADRYLEEMDVQNLYEDAYYNLARFNYFRRWGNEKQQLGALRRAIAHEDHANYLPKRAFRSALKSMFLLQVLVQDYAAALYTWEKVKHMNLGDEDARTMHETVAQILALRDDERSYSVDSEFGDNTSWHYRLLKNRFHVNLRSGEIAEIKLRCDKKYVFFRYKPDMQYEISDKYGTCGIELVGNPGTAFTLVQS